jgi:hypothetical protein
MQPFIERDLGHAHTLMDMSSSFQRVHLPAEGSEVAPGAATYAQADGRLQHTIQTYLLRRCGNTNAMPSIFGHPSRTTMLEE